MAHNSLAGCLQDGKCMNWFPLLAVCFLPPFVAIRLLVGVWPEPTPLLAQCAVW